MANLQCDDSWPLLIFLQALVKLVMDIHIVKRGKAA